ncbi:uncharacterized protein LOC108743054 [Agrilus planipennis]|uniref:KIF-binding protein n=1 Tax=Agrilus planipennis TaxID=224129 RepID=A0A1W4XMF9_AGRPL|nr:uncharacterized protein LOC108743054 [Agrilus planipennis]
MDPNLVFGNLEFAVESVPATPVVTTEQARLLFLHTHTWLKRVRLYYTLRDFPLQYVNGVLDLSELYRYLAFYEPDLESMYNVQKRRGDALETLSGILKEVRPQCYLAVNIEIIRELAEVQIELLSLNLKKLYASQDTKQQEGEDVIKRKIDAVSDIHQRLGSVETYFYARPKATERAVDGEPSDNEVMTGYDTEGDATAVDVPVRDVVNVEQEEKNQKEAEEVTENDCCEDLKNETTNS